MAFVQAGLCRRTFGLWKPRFVRQGSTSSSSPRVFDLDASRLTTIRKVGTPTPMPALEDLKFGQFFTDHFLEVDWDTLNGWNPPVIKPLQPLLLHPGVSSLHYGLQVFEGLKAFRNLRGDIQLFRPDRNVFRLRTSSVRMGLPSFDQGELLKLIGHLLAVDERFIPDKDGFSIYIRPIMISTHPWLGVGLPACAKLTVMLSPCGPYYSTGFKPIQLLAESTFTRAFPGGVGDCKVGGNYGPTIYPQGLAASHGYSQLLWLYPVGDDHFVTEAGTMNMFVYWINEHGEKELVTPPVARNLILPGVMRESVLDLAREIKELKVTERDILMKKDFIQALKENRVLEVFGTGTAAVVSPIDMICYQGTKFSIPLDTADPKSGSGPLARRLLHSIYDIQYGRVEHPWSMSLSSIL